MLSVEDLLERMHFERTKVRTGDCMITGRRTSSEIGSKLDTPLEIRYVFDFASNLMFVDERCSVWVGGAVQAIRRIAFRSEDLLYQHSSADRNSRVVIGRYSLRLPMHAPYGRGTMDLRALGLAPSSFFSGRSNYKLDDVEARMIRNSEIRDTYTLEQLEPGIFVIVGRDTKNPIRLRIFVDSKRGYTPFRMVTDTVVEDAATGEIRVTDTEGQADVGWKDESGVWIPTYCEWTNKRNLIPDGKEDKLENIIQDHQTEKWQIEWYSVNKTLDGSFWSYRNWDLPSDVRVFDYSKDDEKGVFIERIGDGARQIEMQKTVAKKAASFYLFKMAIVTIAFVAVVAWLVRWYGNRHT